MTRGAADFHFLAIMKLALRKTDSPTLHVY